MFPQKGNLKSDRLELSLIVWYVSFFFRKPMLHTGVTCRCAIFSNAVKRSLFQNCIHMYVQVVNALGRMCRRNLV